MRECRATNAQAIIIVPDLKEENHHRYEVPIAVSNLPDFTGDHDGIEIIRSWTKACT